VGNLVNCANIAQEKNLEMAIDFVYSYAGFMIEFLKNERLLSMGTV